MAPTRAKPASLQPTSTTERARPRLAGKEAGFILISVLWLAGIVALLALTFAREARVHIAIQRNAVADAQAQALADGGVMLAIGRLLASEVSSDRPPAFAAPPYAVNTASTCLMPDGSPVTVELLDEGGKIDVNLAGERLLRALLRGVGLTSDHSEQLLATLLDYRDSDDDRRRGGAEAADYRAAGRLSGPRNGPLVGIEELGDVLGFTPEIVSRLQAHITVHSGQSGVDPRTMTRELNALIAAGLDDQQATEPALQAPVEPPARLPPELTAPSSRRVFTIRSRAASSGGSVFVREATVSLLSARPARARRTDGGATADGDRSPGRGRPPGVKIWSWQRGMKASPQRIAPAQTGDPAC